jgi:hypothetical protein
MNYVVATYLLRLVGILLILPAFFPNWFVEWFPGLEAPSMGWVFFAAGITVYVGASIVYRIFYKKEQARRRAEMEKQ